MERNFAPKAPWRGSAALPGIGAIFHVLAVLGMADAQAQTNNIVARDSGTVVNTASGGRTAIRIAAPQAGVSYNAFTRFDVDRSGAEFVNQGINARTIVAEVFSSTPARLNGPVSVSGPRANLIFASQNGISIDGGSFVNFGSVALTTGAVTFKDQTLANGVSVRDIQVDTRSGHLEIGPNGLAADLIHLELIAKTMSIGGPVVNSYTSPTAVTRLVAGDSTAIFDTLASPTDNLTPWVYYTPGRAVGSGIVVDLNAASQVTSGRIELVITDQGAGVRNAGQMLASAGDFRLTGTGELRQNGGTIKAAGNVAIRGQSLQQNSRDDQASQVIAGGSLSIDVTGDIINQSGILSGTIRDANDANSVTAATIKAGGKIVNRSDVGGKMAIIFASDDDLALIAGTDILNIDGRVIGNKNVDFVATGEMRNESSHVGGDPANGGAIHTWSDNTWYRRQHGYTIDQGTLADPEHQAYLVADGAVSIHAHNIVNRGGTINATQGDVHLTATDAIANNGLTVGRFHYSSNCFLFFCKVDATSDERLVGGQINAGHDLTLTAATGIDNSAGQVFAVHDMTLDTPVVTANGSPIHTVLTRTHGLRAFFGDTWAGLYAIDQGGGFTAQQGRLVLTGKGIQNRGYFSAAQGISGTIEVIHTPGRDPITIGEHLGVTAWIGW